MRPAGSFFSNWSTLDTDHTSVGFAIRRVGLAKVRGRFGAMLGDVVKIELNPEFVEPTIALEIRMSDQADQTITALRAGHDELAALVAGMTPDDLTQPSAAAEWDISQVLSHLGSGAEIGLTTLEAALEGTGNPGSEFIQSVWARWNAMTPSQRAEGFLRADEALVTRYESLDDTARGQLRIDLGFLPEPIDVATAAALRLSEFTYHSWDIQVMSDPAAVLAPAAVPLLLDPLGMLIGFLGHSDALDGRQGTLAVQTTEPDRSFGLDLHDAVTPSIPLPSPPVSSTPPPRPGSA